MVYGSRLQNMSWFCWTHVNMLSKTSMTTWKTYNKTLPSSGREQSSRILESCAWTSIRTSTPFPWTSQSVDWGAREYIWDEGCKSPNHRILRTYAWLIWDDSRGDKTNFLNFTVATYIKYTWIRGSHFSHPNIYLMDGAWSKCLHKFPTLGWCSTWIMGETKCCWWAQQQLIGISISLDFHHYVNNVIVLVRPKDVMVYARGINHE